MKTRYAARLLTLLALALATAGSSQALAQCTYPTPVTPDTCADAVAYNA